jgi:molybdopterin synthase catalytic subunit
VECCAVLFVHSAVSNTTHHHTGNIVTFTGTVHGINTVLFHTMYR